MVPKDPQLAVVCREKLRKAQLKRFSDPLEVARMHKLSIESMNDPEVRKKMSESAKKRIIPDDQRKRMVQSRIGLKRTEETKLKMRVAQKNRPPISEETRLKMKVSSSERWKTPISITTLVRMSEAKKGDKTHLWKGGISFEKYCQKFNNGFKERVRLFFGHRCVECGVEQKDVLKKLSIHHVHYDKKMCCNGSPRDVVPLCASCHAKTNTSRDYWEHRFTELLYKNHPDGKCFYTVEEMSKFCGVSQ